MAVGDYISILQEAGVSATFSYTAAAGVNIMVTNSAGSGWNILDLNSWVTSASGVYGWALPTNIVSGLPAKMLLLENQSINATNTNTYGILLTGIQV